MCKNARLYPATYEDNLPVHECKKCGGAWIRFNEYLTWLKSQTPGRFDLTRLNDPDVPLSDTDSSKAAFCPDCGHFMRSYRISSKINFQLDRCNHCNGIWFDHNEWGVLKAVDLHDEVNQVFTIPW